MNSFIVKGGTPLYGSVRLGGAKNASYKLMIAALLGHADVRLLNFSHIADVAATAEIINILGASAVQCGERTFFVNGSKLNTHQIGDKYGPKSRSAPMFIPALLHRFGQAIVPLPGGDKIGNRPLDRFWDGLKQMGATIEQTPTHIKAACKSLTGTTYRFAKNSHTGTESLLMAAVLAHGKTILQNAALEPEIDDMIEMLNNMGARIRRRYHRIIEIDGVDRLEGTIHRIMPDRNEAVSYACAAIASKGDIIVENARREHLESFLEKLEEIGGGYEIGKYGIRFYHRGELRSTDIITEPHPGFMTDWQPLWSVLLTQATGQSIIHEAVFPSRFQYIDHLQQMGVKIRLFNPQVKNPDKFYNFNLNDDNPAYYHAVEITGPSKLKAGEFHVKDLRHGATMVIAALTAQGTSTIHNIAEIERGYEDLESRLRSMGAHITRTNDPA